MIEWRSSFGVFVIHIYICFIHKLEQAFPFFTRKKLYYFRNWNQNNNFFYCYYRWWCLRWGNNCCNSYTSCLWAHVAVATWYSTSEIWVDDNGAEQMSMVPRFGARTQDARIFIFLIKKKNQPRRHLYNTRPQHAEGIIATTQRIIDTAPDQFHLRNMKLFISFFFCWLAEKKKSIRWIFPNFWIF